MAAREVLKSALEPGSKYSLENLMDAIRRGMDLAELTRLIGPTQEENELAARRLEKIGAIWKRNEKEYGCNPDLWPFHERRPTTGSWPSRANSRGCAARSDHD